MKAIVRSVILSALYLAVIPGIASAAGSNTLVLGFGGHFGDYGLKAEHGLTDRLALGLLQSWQAGNGFTMLTSRFNFGSTKAETKPFITYAYGGVANESYPDQKGGIIGIGISNQPKRTDVYTEFTINTISSVEAPYTLNGDVIFYGISFGKRY